MAADWIKKQSEVIKSATRDAARSKESAQQFLRNAGIIKPIQQIEKGKKKS